MVSRVAIDPQQLGIADIAAHMLDIQSSLMLFFSQRSPDYIIRFSGYRMEEVRQELDDRLSEIDLLFSFYLLSSLEAAFRVDYLQRCYNKDKAPISRYFRDLYSKKGQNVELDRYILQSWQDHYAEYRKFIGEMRGALNFRHWVAHGQYWVPKLGRRYDYNSVYSLASDIFSNFPFLR